MQSKCRYKKINESIVQYPSLNGHVLSNECLERNQSTLNWVANQGEHKCVEQTEVPSHIGLLLMHTCTLTTVCFRARRVVEVPRVDVGLGGRYGGGGGGSAVDRFHQRPTACRWPGVVTRSTRGRFVATRSIRRRVNRARLARTAPRSRSRSAACSKRLDCLYCG